jgi:hypothetical protein
MAPACARTASRRVSGTPGASPACNSTASGVFSAWARLPTAVRDWRTRCSSSTSRRLTSSTSGRTSRGTGPWMRARCPAPTSASSSRTRRSGASARETARPCSSSASASKGAKTASESKPVSQISWRARLMSLSHEQGHRAALHHAAAGQHLQRVAIGAPGLIVQRLTGPGHAGFQPMGAPASPKPSGHRPGSAPRKYWPEPGCR